MCKETREVLKALEREEAAAEKEDQLDMLIKEMSNLSLDNQRYELL